MWYLAGLPIVDNCHSLVVNAFLWTTLALTIVILRLYTRAILVRALGWDDCLMAAAMVCSIANTVSTFLEIRFGLGQVFDQAPPPIKFFAALYATVPFYCTTQTLYKLSLTMQVSRLLTSMLGKRAILVAMLWIGACGLMTLCGSLFYCFPVSKAWDYTEPGWCVDRGALFFVMSGVNIFNDIVLLVSPLPSLLRANLPQKQQLILICVFLCGIFTTAVSCVRLNAMRVVAISPIIEQPVMAIPINLWSLIEINVAIICGSIPSIKVFVSRVVLRQPSISTSPTFGLHSPDVRSKDSTAWQSVNDKSLPSNASAAGRSDAAPGPEQEPVELASLDEAAMRTSEQELLREVPQAAVLHGRSAVLSQGPGGWDKIGMAG